MSLREAIKSAAAEGRALGHFNVSDSVALRAVAEAAGELQVPVLIGVSEGEREFLGVRQIAALVRSLREAGRPVFLNADHTHSLEKIREAVEAGFDAVLLDGGKLSLEENIAKTREVVEYVRSVSPETIVEGELGYIGSSSAMLAELPPDAALRPEELTSAEQAEEFVRATGVDLLSPAVGNIHGMLRNAPNPALDIPPRRLGHIGCRSFGGRPVGNGDRAHKYRTPAGMADGSRTGTRGRSGGGGAL